MAHNSQLPCDGDGMCMLCKKKPSEEETLTCKTCITPWHVNCLSSPPETLSSTLQWECPDCSPVTGDLPLPVIPQNIAAGDNGTSGNLIAVIRGIEADESLTDQEKAKKRQELLSRGGKSADLEEDKSKKKKKDKEKTKGEDDVLDLFDGNLNCSFCMQLPDRPVTTPCGHNFCLKCFQKWTGQGKRTCAKCRNNIPPKMASHPRINSALVVAIRMARVSKLSTAVGPLKVQHFVHNQNRPDKAFTTERAKKAGKANACSGKIFVTVPPDHFGPILAENDPERRQGVLVGECWEDRMECRQWGAHLPHVAGIAGQSEYGAQSVALSGGYEDDEDHGEWFLYTGSGGRDLSGNKRTNNKQSFDQKFEKMNEALRVSCKKGYPVRVVRSHKEKRSSYAPESGVRYDGVYRIEKCWRKIGIQGFKVCRYLFVRCDNEPAPWTSDEHGDCPRPLPVIKELKQATDITGRKETPSWDYDEEEGRWKWKKPPPLSRKPMDSENPEERKRARRAIKLAQNLSVREKLLKEFSCLLCRKVMTLPLTTPCAHNFCKPCLEGAFAGQAFVRERTCEGRRTLRAQKTVMNCPSCPTDISEFLQNPQVNRELMDVIESLQSKTDENIEETEENVELGEEGNDSEEKAEVVIEDTKASTEDSEISEGEDKEIQKNPTDTNTSGKKPDGVLQSKTDENIEETEENVESGEQDNDSEKAEVVIEDTKASTEDSEIPEGEDKETQKNPTDSKHKQTRKRKKENTSGKKPDGVNKYIEEMPQSGKKNLQTPTSEIKSDRTSKRRKANGGDQVSRLGGVRTRSMRSKELVAEGNKSPSSPLKVQSGDHVSRLKSGVRTRSMRSKELVDDGNDSPSSPLHVQSDNDDFE
ncbi:zinc finger protein [Macleaya cordata]|uniref:RING-type E3 ubiquitin transferase n=1 Tax=Macleaya cordata TaxID=56857 RepID=A0A200R3U3_MACCD|nr:zinc finger protein [Macleaya cordata]